MADTVCKYFLHGACSRGTECKYSHDRNAKTDNVCKYYQSGSCSYGKSCRYDHIKVSKPPSSRVVKPPVIDIDSGQSSSSKVVLGKKTPSKEAATAASEAAKPKQWFQATEFVPGRKSHLSVSSPPEEKVETATPGGLYSKIVSLHNNNEEPTGVVEYQESGTSYEGESSQLLCPFAQVRDCPYGDDCTYLHGDLCDMCGCLCLHPTDLTQRMQHRQECLEHHTREMELAFAAQRSSGMSCAICLDVVKEKTDITERQFGILENCNHAFCLACIRKWRVASQLEKTVIRACPICRVVSWFVTPSDFWVEDAEEKSKLINNYKEHLQTKHCRNFDRGNGSCQFGSSCFYKHVYPDGTEEVVTKLELRHTEDSEGLSSVLRTPMLSEFIALRDT